MRISDAQAKMLCEIWTRGFLIHLPGESETADALVRKECLERFSADAICRGTYPTGKVWTKIAVSRIGAGAMADYFGRLAADERVAA